MPISQEAQQNKPRKPLNSYFQFRNQKLQELQNDTNKIQTIKSLWNNLSPQVKQQMQQNYQTQLEQYNNDVQAWLIKYNISQQEMRNIPKKSSNQNQESKQENLIGPSYEQIKKRWNNMSSIYITFDSAPQTFFYTLSNMLKLDEAKNVLEIACGAGKLIPSVLDLKAPQTFYYATDISEEMINFAKIRLEKNFLKYKSTLTFEEWMKEQNLEFGIVNGEQKIPKQIKFDRIFCNLVLMLTRDPKNMLLNLWESAAQGCLLGLTVWGTKGNSNLFEFVQDLSQQHGLMAPNARSNFFLSERIETLVEQCGWETMMKWQQSTLFPIIEHSQGNVHPFIGKEILSRFPQHLHEQVLERVDYWINKQKCGLTFGGKLMIVRKKSKIE